jgi:hypothetical protein
MDALFRLFTLNYSASVVKRDEADSRRCMERLCNVSYVLEQRKKLLDAHVVRTNEDIRRQVGAPGVSPQHKKEMCRRLLRKRMLLEKEAVALVDMRSRAEEVVLLIGQRELVGEYMSAMQEANRYLKTISKAYGIGDAEKLVDDVGDNNEDLAALQTALSTPFSLEISDDDLDRELDELMSGSSNGESATPQQTPRLPAAVSQPPLAAATTPRVLAAITALPAVPSSSVSALAPPQADISSSSSSSDAQPLVVVAATSADTQKRPAAEAVAL